MIRLPLDLVWTPDTVLMNNVDYYKHDEKTDANIVVYSDGTIVWDQSLITKSSCPMNVRYFPFDSQTCKNLRRENGNF